MTFCVKAQALLSESFESGTLPTGWTAIDSDGDSYNWSLSPFEDAIYANTGSGYIASASYINNIGALNPNNWLITPQISIPAEGAILSFYTGAFGYPEPLEVLVSTTGNTVADFTSTAIYNQSITNDITEGGYVLATVNLSNYAGQSIYIAFVHRNSYDNYWLFLDDITINAVPSTPTISVTPSTLVFNNTLVGDTSVATLNVDAYNLTSDITAVSATPFEISADGINYGYSATLTNATNVLSVRYIPTASTIDSAVISFTSGSVSTDVNVYGTGIDCNVTFPLHQDFETVEDVTTCWSVLSANSVNQMSIVSGMSTTGNASFRFNSYSSASDYTQYIITPELPVTTDTKMVSFDYAGYTSGTETFVVGYSSTTNDPTDQAAFTWGTTNSVTGTTWHTFLKSDIPGDAKYIAIKYTSSYQYYMYVDNMVVDETPDCFMPNAVNVSGITFEQAVINWTPMGNETSWEVVVVEHGNDVSTGAIEYVSAHPYTATNLMPYTQYDVYVLAECTEGNSNWTPVTTFTTLPFCQIPTGISASNISYDHADINWNPAGQETNWNLVVVEHGGDVNNGTVIPVTQRPYTVTGLTTNTQYDVYVAADCISETSPWSSVYTFSTTPDCSNPTNLQFSEISGTAARVSWTAAPYAVTNYIVEYGESGNPNTYTVNVNGATSCFLTGLNPTTEYSVSVLSECNSQDITPVAITGTFTTNCLVGGVITIGESSSTNYYFPNNTCYNYSLSQQIYQQSEIGGSNTFNYIVFDCNEPASNPTRNITVWLMHTSEVSPTNWLPLTTAQQVFSGSYTFTQGHDTIMFDAPFQYNGSENLAVVVYDQTGSYSCSNYYNAYSITGQSLYFYSDTDNPAPSATHTPTVSPYSTSIRADIIFGGVCDSTATCVAPVITNVATAADEITVEWAAGYNESTWNMEYKAVTDTTWISEGTVTSPYTLYNLDANTYYNIRIISDCGGTYSTPALVNAKTECVPFTLPLVEDFSTVPDDAIPDCWTRGTNYSGSEYPYKTTYYNDNKPCLYFYSSSSNYCYIALPELEASVAMDSLLVSFKTLLTYSDYFVDFGIMTDPNDISTFTMLGRHYSSDNYDWERTEIRTNNYTGNGRYLAFRAKEGVTSYNYAYLTDINVDYIPSCQHVENVTLRRADSSSAVIGWTAGGTESTWSYAYGPAGTTTINSFTDGDWTDVYEDSVQLDNLSASTEYVIFIKASCDDGSYSSAEVFNFKTSCGAISNLPFEENFDSYTVSWDPYTRPDCWEFPVIYSNSYPYITDDNYAVSQPNTLKFSSDPANPTTAVMPQFSADIHTLQMTFKLKAESTTYSGTFEVGVCSNPADMSTFESVLIIQPNTVMSEYFVKFDSTQLSGGGNYIVFRQHSNSSSWYYWIDDIYVETIPTCARPSEVHITGTTTNTITIGWTPAGDETDWNVICVPTGTDPNSPDYTPTAVQSTTYEFTNLEDTVIYDIYVQADCGNGDLSNWRNIIGVRPGQYNMPLSGTDTVIMCGGHLYDNGGLSNDYHPNSNATVILMPDAPGMLINLNGSYNTELCCDKLQIYDGVGTSGTMIGEYAGTGNINIVSTTGPVTLYFYSDGSLQYGGYDLEVTCTQAPSCMKPQNVVSTGATTTTIDLSWTEMGTATSWNIEYGPAGFTQGNGTMVTATTNPFTVTGLTSSTNYDFYVQADCGGGDESDWSNKCTVATDCEPISTPYFENFDSYTGTTYNMAGVVPTCWTSWSNNTSYPAPHIGGGGSSYVYTVSGNALVFTAGDAGNDAYAVLPTFVQDLNTLKINFSRAMESTASGTLTVGYVTNSLDPHSTFVLVSTIPSVSNHDTISVDFSTVADVPATGNIAFHWHHNLSWYSCSIEDVNVTSSDTTGGTVETCDAPTNLAVSNVTTTGATATWTAGGAETAWNLQYKAASAADWSSAIPVSAATYTFTGLTPNTQYQVRVQAACDATTTSDWTPAVSFTTAQESGNECAAPSNLASTGTEAHTITITWTENGTATSWTVYYRVNGATSWITETANATNYTITGLEPETEYTIQVVANCADGEASEPSNTINVTTQPDGIEDYDAAAVSVFPNPTTGMVQVSSTKYQVSSVDVYDVYGKLLKTDAMIDNNTVNMSGYAAGVYFLRVSTENGVVTKRVVKR